MNWLQRVRSGFHYPLLLRSVSAYVVFASVLLAFSLIPQPPVTPVEVPVYTPVANPVEARRVIQGEPVSITVKRLKIDLPVKEGSYNAETQEWTLSNSDAFFATVSDLPNDYRGSTFIYGHNRRSVFAPLANIKAGDTVKITTDNGHVFTYSYRGDAKISPDVTDILYEDPDQPQLVLMTCDGVFSAARRIMYFDLTGVDA